MELKKLDESFYNDNPKIIQALDFDHETQQWLGNKVRGHGIVSITINGLTFAIPVRSYIKHKASFILEVNTKDRSVKGMGLDYSKAMLIRDSKHVSQEAAQTTSK